MYLSFDPHWSVVWTLSFPVFSSIILLKYQKAQRKILYCSLLVECSLVRSSDLPRILMLVWAECNQCINQAKAEGGKILVRIVCYCFL
jgi:hypothetical protein